MLFLTILFFDKVIKNMSIFNLLLNFDNIINLLKFWYYRNLVRFILAEIGTASPYWFFFSSPRSRPEAQILTYSRRLPRRRVPSFSPL